MQLFEGYTTDELHRVLSVSRWVAASLFIGGFVALIINQWLIHRIAEVQKAERQTAQKRLVQAEEELRRIRKQTSEVVSTFDKLTSSRKLSSSQLPVFRTALDKGERGKVIVTFLTVEWDAEEYAVQIANVMKESGIDVMLSDQLWAHFDEEDVFLTSNDPNPPPVAQTVQRAFESIGVVVPFIHKPETAEAVGAKSGEAVLVISNRPGSSLKNTTPRKESISR